MTEKIEVETKEEFSMADFQALQATNQRILDEHRSDKVKYKSKLDAFEQAESLRMAEKNDFKSLHEQAAGKITTLENELADSRYNSFTKNLTLEVNKLAKDAHNPNAVIRALNINDDNTDLDAGTLTDLSAQIDVLRKNEHYLFNVGGSAQTTTVPRYVKQSQQAEKSTADMTVAELEAKIKNNFKTRMG